MNLFEALKAAGDSDTCIFVDLAFENTLGVNPDISMRGYDYEYLSQDTLAMKVVKIAAKNGALCICVKKEEDKK